MEDDRLTKLEKEVSEIKTRVAIAETNIKGIYKILDSINNNTTWMLRITIGAIIVAVMNLILHGKF
ncbi:hemolysin XhlA family protein [Neobacillus sp. NPDC093127]|uniref:hemolysin XhlA family protein n=1 Tax=Neobacillus sp. NPDC093127 TaxID=3364296 RepID=UPI00381BA16C